MMEERIRGLPRDFLQAVAPGDSGNAIALNRCPLYAPDDSPRRSNLY